jgi:hypothetical protein
MVAGNAQWEHKICIEYLKIERAINKIEYRCQQNASVIPLSVYNRRQGSAKDTRLLSKTYFWRIVQVKCRYSMHILCSHWAFPATIRVVYEFDDLC